MKKPKKNLLGWKLKKERIGGKWTTVLAPRKSKELTYEEGIERIREALKKLKNGNGN